MRQINYENKALDRATYIINGVRYTVSHKHLFVMRTEGEEMLHHFKDSDDLHKWLRWNNAKRSQ